MTTQGFALIRNVMALLALSVSVSAFSQNVVISTGASGNTYDTMVKQLAAVCQSEIGRPIISKPSSGSMENVDRLLNNEIKALSSQI